VKPGDVGETAEPDPKATRNERVKLTATWLNTVGSASVTTGVIAPIDAYVLDVAAVPASRVVFLSLFWLLSGGGLHWLARRHLEGLRKSTCSKPTCSPFPSWCSPEARPSPIWPPARIGRDAHRDRRRCPVHDHSARRVRLHKDAIRFSRPLSSNFFDSRPGRGMRIVRVG
jgi:hypothetical protein